MFKQYEDTPAFWERFVREELCAVAFGAERAIKKLRGTAGAGIAEHDSHAGDIVTLADQWANRAIRMRLERCTIPLALLDEEHGVLEQLHPDPKVGLIVDELDGTRPFRMGMGTVCISIAAYPLSELAELRNVRCGVLLALDTGVMYVFVRGRGAWRILGDDVMPLAPARDATKLKDACVFMDEGTLNLALNGMYLQPFNPNVKIGTAAMCSCCYGGVLMVEGGTHAMVHLGYRQWEKWPEVRPSVHAVWGRLEPGPQSYDVAAIVPLMWELGYTVTDAFGLPLDRVVIDQCGNGHQVRGVIAAANAGLHREVLEAIEAREQYLLEHRDEAVRLL